MTAPKKVSANKGHSVLSSILFYLPISGSSQRRIIRMKEILTVSQLNNNSGAPSGRNRRLPIIMRPPASYGAFLPKLELGDSKSRD
jgi:hypothetical protein